MEELPDRSDRAARRPGGPRLSRRGLVGGALAAALAPAATPGDNPPAPSPDAPITPEDVAAADRLAGRTHSDEERRQMVRRLGPLRDRLRALRSAAPDSMGEPPAVRFDPLLPGMTVPKGRPLLRPSRNSTPGWDGRLESLAFAPVTLLSRLLRERRISSLELTRFYLERLKRFGPRLLCVVTLTEERALEQARRADRELAAGRRRGPLHGIPYGAKDLFATRGIPTTFGAAPYRNQIFDEDATVIRKLEEAGAVLAAKLSMGELALGDVWFGGVTRCPWDPRRGSSGSSAGSGSAVAAGLVGFALGTETLGSIVSPCCVNGVTGLRPTFGRVSRHGAMALAWSMDKIGPMCRGVEDCALVLAAICGPDGRDPTAADLPFRWDPDALPLRSLRVGLDAASFEAVLDPAVRRVYDEALGVLRSLGLALEPIHLPASDPLYLGLPGIVIDVEGAAAFERLKAAGGLRELARQTDGAWPNVFRTASTVPATEYLQAQRLRARLQREMARALEGFDLYVTAPRVGPSLVYTNLTGHPTLVTRCGMANGLPVMIEFTGGLYREEAILRVALAFERATDHHTRWPDVDRLPPVPPPLDAAR